MKNKFFLKLYPNQSCICMYRKLSNTKNINFYLNFLCRKVNTKFSFLLVEEKYNWCGNANRIP